MDEEQYEEEAHLVPEEETTTHTDFGGGIFKIEVLVPCSMGGLHQRTVFILAANMHSAIEVALESFGAKDEGDLTVLSSVRLDNTDSRFLVPRSFMKNAEENWLFRMRPGRLTDDHMN